jgi:hypothetical protein
LCHELLKAKKEVDVKKRVLGILLFFAFSPLAAAPQGKNSLSIDVTLFPAGSFTITSDDIQGKGFRQGSLYQADKFSVPIESLKTGIDLRNGHMHKKLTGTSSEKIPQIVATNIQAKDSSGTADFTILGITKKTAFTFKDLGNNRAEAHLTLSLKDFGITGVSYLGVGVVDEVSLTITIGYENK